MPDQNQTIAIQAACIQAAAILVANNEVLRKGIDDAGEPTEVIVEAVTNLAALLFDSWVSANLPAGPI